MSEASFETNFRAWRFALGRKVDMLGLAGQKALRDESSRITATLIKLSGPRSVQRAKQRIEDKVNSKFAILSQDNPHSVEDYNPAGKAGCGDVRWYAFYPDAIFGVAKDKDMRGASGDELYNYFLQTRVNKLGRIVAGKRGKQRVYIWQKVLTKRASINKLIKRLKDHIGRRQAGWLKAWRATGALVVGNPVPQQVLKHEQGSRGTFIDGTKSANMPEFTIINQAVGSGKLREMVSRAFTIRAGALSKDLALYVRGVKKLDTIANLK